MQDDSDTNKTYPALIKEILWNIFFITKSLTQLVTKKLLCIEFPYEKCFKYYFFSNKALS